MNKIGIIGATGYTAGELLRILLHHPYVDIKSLISNTQYGKSVSSVHKDLLGETDLKFTNKLDPNIDLVFLCLGHGKSKTWLKIIPKNVNVIDLSNDFRLLKKSNFEERNFIYGLPELQINLIKKAKNIANPGCFATAIQLALLPLAKEKLIKENIHISAITGSTGLGKMLSENGNFNWRSNNISIYKPFIHEHLYEIKESLIKLQKKSIKEIFFIPYRGNFTRGIFTTVYMKCDISIEDANFLYKDFYKSSSFVHISDNYLDIKQVINTNKCLLFLIKEKKKLIINSVLDNLLKGASGQAVQNFNIMNGYNEKTALYFKSIVF